MEQIRKTINEKLTFTIDLSYYKSILSGAIISSATLKAYNLVTKELDNTVLTSTTATIDGGKVLGQVKDGISGYDYKVVILAILSNSEKIETAIELTIVP